MSTDLPPLGLAFAARVHVDLQAPLDVGPGLLGQRRIVPIVGGSIRGPRLEAEILHGGGDWQTVTADGTIVIDTRYMARTTAGAVISITTSGLRYGTPEALEKLARGEAVSRDEYTFVQNVRLESGAPELAWINRTLFVATAARQQSSVFYDLYAVV